MHRHGLAGLMGSVLSGEPGRLAIRYDLRDPPGTVPHASGHGAKRGLRDQQPAAHRRSDEHDIGAGQPHGAQRQRHERADQAAVYPLGQRRVLRCAEQT